MGRIDILRKKLLRLVDDFDALFLLVNKPRAHGDGVIRAVFELGEMPVIACINDGFLVNVKNLLLDPLQVAILC